MARMREEPTVAELEAENERLRGLLHDLKEEIRGRDEFIATLGHELRNPLSPIFLQLQQLLQQVGGSSADTISREWLMPRLQTFQRRINRFLEVLNQLLEVSTVNAVEVVLYPEELDLAEIVRDICATMEREFAVARSELTLTADESISGCWDRLRVEQIVRNLISNAVRYGAGKPIHVRLEGDETRARLFVEDRGIGIASADQERIFHRFERATGKGQAGGFGIGLWLVRELCTAMGGRVEVQSELGQGATFWVELPRRLGEGR